MPSLSSLSVLVPASRTSSNRSVKVCMCHNGYCFCYDVGKYVMASGYNKLFPRTVHIGGTVTTLASYLFYHWHLQQEQEQPDIEGYTEIQEIDRSSLATQNDFSRVPASQIRTNQHTMFIWEVLLRRNMIFGYQSVLFTSLHTNRMNGGCDR